MGAEASDELQEAIIQILFIFLIFNLTIYITFFNIICKKKRQPSYVNVSQCALSTFTLYIF